jgi:dihydrofolate synthase/folylpolyglutamate synthase
MDYPGALAYLESLGTFGIQLGLKRIEELLAQLDHPERKFRSIHVAGTNGKGSTAAYIASVLSEAGIRTGIYVSPHLVDYPERMKINGEEIAKEQFAAIMEEVRLAAGRVQASGLESPTEFEVLTAAAFLWFVRQQAEFVVVEVGLGGLLDSTNVIVAEVSVITNVTLDHTDRCGDTVEAIAKHKAGIIKQGIPVVTGAVGRALAVIEQTAKLKESACYVLERDFFVSEFAYGTSGQHFSLEIGSEEPKVFHSRLLGRHQADNAALAIYACELLKQGEARITDRAIAEGIKKAFWPARFEIIPGEPTVVLDGAHNLDGIRVLRQTLDEVYPARARVFLFGVLADKDYIPMMRLLFRATDRVVVVRPNSERAAEAAKIAVEIREFVAAVKVGDSIAGGLQQARQWAGPDGIVCVAGSLYMVGEARKSALC